MVVKVLELMLVLSTIAVTSIMGQREIGLSGPQIRELELGQNPALLEFAALTLETVMVTIDGPETVAAAQEGVNLNIWCLPWLQRFPGASIRWLSLGADTDTFEPIDTAFEFIDPTAPDNRQAIDGPFNEWLNITGTVLVTGAESPDTGIYQCEVCFLRGTPFEECHRANVSVQIIGGPPIIDEGGPNDGPLPTSTELSLDYRIGTDFCIEPDYNGTVNLRCDITNEGPGNVSRAFPPPDRSWFLNNDRFLIAGVNENANLGQFSDFFTNPVERMSLLSDFFVPAVLAVADQSGISLNFELENSTGVTQMIFPDAMGLDQLQARAREFINRAIVGDWSCELNNTFGSDVATSTIRICGEAPNLRQCPSGPNQIIFAMTGSVVPVGCIVCIPEGAVVTLDCTGQSQSSVGYEWRDNENNLVSTQSRFTTGNDNNYTCTGTNIDDLTEIRTTILAYSDTASYTAQVTERGISQPRRDNGCSRLRNQTGFEGMDVVCIFVGETLDLRCVTDDAMMNALEITGPGGGVIGNGTVRVENVMTTDGGIYGCRLSTSSGPCAQATFTMNVQVFDPARIDRVNALSPLLCDFGAGRPSDIVFAPVGQPVTLCCPVTGIEDPSTGWFEVVVDEKGCASEVTVQGQEVGVGNVDVEVFVNNSRTYVCRTSNNAGADAGVVSIRTDLEAPFFEEGPLSECSERCRDGVRTRRVLCRDNINRMVLPDTVCVDLGLVRPPTEVSCASEYPDECLRFPIWITGEWSPCVFDCGGWRVRSVECRVVMTNDLRPAGECGGQPKPLDYDFEGCPKCCIEDQYPRYCRSLGAGFCGDNNYSERCCWTCGRKLIGYR